MLNRPASAIRVVQVVQNLHYGGMERLLHDTVRALDRKGFELHVVVVDKLGRFAEGLDEVAVLHQLPAMSKLSFLHPAALISRLRGIGADIVHSHGGIWYKASRAARRLGIPLVHTEHGRPDPDRVIDRLVDNLASRSTEVVIAVSEAVADVLRRRVVHDPARVRVITNGVKVERLESTEEPLAVRRELGIPDGALVIGSVGRLEAVKNYRLALEALARLADRSGGEYGDRAYLVLVGDGSGRAELEGYARDLGIAGRVRFLGWRDDAERLYRAFDLFTLTSRSEGTSVSLLEAMGSGLCPIVTDVGGNRAVLGDDLSCLLVAPDDEAGLAAAWISYLSDAERRKAVGDRARRRVQAVFSLDGMVEKYASLYRELGYRRPRSRPGAGR